MKKSLEHKRDIPQYVAAWQAWGESILVAGVALGLGFLLSPRDPFFLKSGFPWPLLAPLFAGLRHGVAGGAGAAVVLVVGMGLCWRQGTLNPFPLQLSLAHLVFGIVGGEFAGMWRRRAQRLVTRLEYARMRLDEFTRTYHVLRDSFEVLNRKNLTDPHNLREAIITFRKELASAEPTKQPLLGLGDQLLSLFVDFAQLHAAALCAVDEQGALVETPVACRGPERKVSARDPLIAAVLKTRQAHNVASDFRGREHETPWLVAVPLVDVTGRLHGVLAVERMLFSSFQATVLTRMAVLGGHAADLLAFRGPATIEADFRKRVERARQDAKTFGLESSAVCLQAPRDRVPTTLFRTLLDKRRGLDGALHVQHDKKGECVFLLLPLTDQLGLQGYRERLTKMMAELKLKAEDTPEIQAFSLRSDADFQALLDRLDVPFEAAQTTIPIETARANRA